jgi:hypothetical protein
MAKQSIKFGSSIPELQDVIKRYGCGLGDSPPYIVFGSYNSKASGPVMGILAVTSNEFYANIILREVKKNGRADVMRSEFHPNTNFNISVYKQTLQDKMEAQKQAEEQEKQLTEKVAAPKPKLELIK